MSTEHFDIWACHDCYMAHHYGASEHPDQAGVWFVDGSDRACDREPLGRLDGYHVADNTCPEHMYDHDDDADTCDHCGRDADDDNGIDDFSWRQCGGCDSILGGSRYRLAVWLIR